MSEEDKFHLKKNVVTLDAGEDMGPVEDYRGVYLMYCKDCDVIFSGSIAKDSYHRRQVKYEPDWVERYNKGELYKQDIPKKVKA